MTPRTSLFIGTGQEPKEADGNALAALGERIAADMADGVALA